jgi:hypothetical protein
VNDKAAPRVSVPGPDDPSDKEEEDKRGTPRDDMGSTALVDRPPIKTFLGIAGFAIAVAGLLIGVWVNFLRPQSDVDGGSPGPSTAASPGSSSRTGGPSPLGDTPTVGQCFTAEWMPTGCDVVHHWELIAVDDACGPPELLAYLGGVSGIDVLISDATPLTRTVDGRNGCFIGAPGGGAMEGSMRDALQEAHGDIWRRCIDDRVAREVTCAEPHTDEVVSPPVAGEVNCQALADAYAETSLARFGLELSIGAQGPEGRQ